MKKKLRLIDLFNEESEKQRQIVGRLKGGGSTQMNTSPDITPAVRGRGAPALGKGKFEQFNQFAQNYGLNSSDAEILKRIMQKMSQSGKSLVAFIQAAQQQFPELSGDEGPSDNIPQPSTQTEDPFADFEGEEEDPQAAAEAQQFQNTLNQRKQMSQKAAQSGYFGQGAQQDYLATQQKPKKR